MSLPVSETEILLLHNPRCSKSRATEVLLEQAGVEYQTRTYLEEPLSRTELAELARRLDRPAAEFVRRGQSEFAEAGLSAGSSQDEILDAMAAHPILMERPILVRGERAAIGRPPENVRALLED